MTEPTRHPRWRLDAVALGLIAIFMLPAGLRKGLTRPVAVAWLAFGLLHLAYHVGHLDGYATADQIGLVGSLVIVPALAATALWSGRQER